MNIKNDSLYEGFFFLIEWLNVKKSNKCIVAFIRFSFKNARVTRYRGFLPNSTLGPGKKSNFGYLFHYCDFPYANFGLFCPKNRTNEINRPKFVKANIHGMF